MWNILLFIAFLVLLWYCSIKAYFAGRKDRFEGNEEEIEEDFESDYIDWDCDKIA